jgi:hypothetical protein
MFEVTKSTVPGGTFCVVIIAQTRPLASDLRSRGLVANAGLVVPATLMVHLGLEALIDTWVRTGSARAGRKVLTVVAALIAGATHIDHVNMLRAGATGRVLPFKPMAASTVGAFLRSFTFGHIRQLDAVLSRTLGRAWATGAAPATARWWLRHCRVGVAEAIGDRSHVLAGGDGLGG